MRSLGIVLLLVTATCLIRALMYVTESEAEKTLSALALIAPANTAMQEQARRCQTDKTIPAALCEQLRYQAESAEGTDFGHRIMVEALRRERSQQMTKYFVGAGVSLLASLFCFWRARNRSSIS